MDVNFKMLGESVFEMPAKLNTLSISHSLERQFTKKIEIRFERKTKQSPNKS